MEQAFSPFLCFSVFMAALAGVGYFICKLILRPKGNETSLSVDHLHASELAFLVRPGDSTHCLIVLAVDYLQKLLKTPDAQLTCPDSPAYEKEIVGALKSYISDWSKQKALDMVPELKTRNPVKIFSGLLRVKMWLAESFKALHIEIARDPLSIRRYFSPSGILRTVLTLAASSARLQLEQSLQEHLTEQNLLLTEARRQQISSQISVFASIYLIATVSLCAIFPGTGSIGAKITLVLGAAIAGIALRIVCSLPFLVPFVEELIQVMDSVTREGFRINLLRVLLGSARAIFWILVFCVFSSLLLVQSFLLQQIFLVNAEFWIMNLAGYAAIALNFALITHYFILAYRIAVYPQLSDAGRRALSQMHIKVQNRKLVQVCTELLTQAGYNEDLSFIVAIYGIETLFLLA